MDEGDHSDKESVGEEIVGEDHVEDKDGKPKRSYEKMVEEIKIENSKSFISKISEPLLKKNRRTEKKILKNKFVVIGITQVVKAIRKGVDGIVFLAIDVFPIDIICHMPVFCEEHKIPYTFVTTKNKLARLCKLKRSVTCLFLPKPNIDIDKFEATVNEFSSKKKISNYAKLYEKMLSGVKKNHPFFQS